MPHIKKIFHTTITRKLMQFYTRSIYFNLLLSILLDFFHNISKFIEHIYSIHAKSFIFKYHEVTTTTTCLLLLFSAEIKLGFTVISIKIITCRLYQSKLSRFYHYNEIRIMVEVSVYAEILFLYDAMPPTNVISAYYNISYFSFKFISLLFFSLSEQGDETTLQFHPLTTTIYLWLIPLTTSKELPILLLKLLECR